MVDLSLFMTPTAILIASLAIASVGYLYYNRSGSVLTKEYKKFKLIKKEQLTTGVTNPVTLFRFAIPRNATLGLPIGQHISVRAMINGEEIIRYYTPTSAANVVGYFDLVVKIYPQGKMSQHLDSMKIGDSIEVSGPKGVHPYKNNQSKYLGLIAGGTGITPCYQVIQHVLTDPTDRTNIVLLYGNLTEEDIIIRNYLEDLENKYPNRFKLYNVLNHPPEGWTQGKGFITKEIIEKFFAKPSEDVRVGMCGPPVMINVMRTNLKELGYNKDQVYNY